MPSISLERGAPKGYQQLTITSSSSALTLPLASANGALITIETQGNVRWRDDGTAPTGTTGHVLYSGNFIELTDHDAVKNFQAILSSDTVSNVTMNITYYHRH